MLPTGASTTYTVTGTNPTTGCVISGNVSVSTNVSPLALSGVTPATSTICAGSSVTLSAAPTGGCIPYSYSWSDGTNVVGTAATLTVSPSSTTTYTVTVTDNATNTVNASSTITVNNPQPSAVAGQTKCGTSASFVLGATPGNGSDVLNWYAAATGGSSLATGTSFTTPTITTSTNYYVEEASGFVSGLGLDATTVPTSTGASAERGIVFTATGSFKLLSAQYYSPTTSVTNTVTVRLVDNATGTQITTKTLTIPQGATAAWYTMNLGFDITPGTYRLLAGFSQSVNRSTTGFTYPYALSTLGSITSGYDGAISSTTYSYFHNITIQTGCTGLRVPVAATLNAPPAFTLSSSALGICPTQTTSAVTITAGAASYDTYTWSPATNVSGDATSGWTFNPAATTTYTLTASQSAGTCSTTATVVVTVNANPVVTALANPTSVCQNSIATLTANVPTTYVFSSSTGTLDPMVGATSVIGVSNDDTPTAAPDSIGFTFNLNGVDYTQYSVSPDGWILLGNTAATSQFTNVVTSTTNIPKIYPYWDDLATGTDGSVKTLVTGTAPNRIFKVEWNVTIPRNTTGASDSKFQAWLYESTGKVEFRYGAMGTPSSGSISAGYTVSATTYNSISYSTNTSSSTTANDINSTAPVSGTMYSYSLSPTTISWSPTTNLYTDALASVPYTGTPASVVYAKPSATTTYTATATSPQGCTATGQTTITVNFDQVGNIIGGANAVCLGSPVVVDFNTDYATNASAVSWVSSNPGVATIDANGTITALAAGQTTVRARIVNTLTGCTTYAPNDQIVNVYPPIAITSQPSSLSVLTGATVSFSVVTSGSVVSYQWQVSTTGDPGTFSNLSNGGAYSNVTLASMNVNTATLDGVYYYSCLITGNSPCAASENTNTVSLSVSVIAISNPNSVTLCNTGAGSATFSVTTTGQTPDIVRWQLYNTLTSTWDFIDPDDSGSIAPLTFSGADTTTLTLNGLTTTNNGGFVRAFAVIFDTSTVVYSNGATITVNIPALISSSTGNKTVCYSGGTSTFAVTATSATAYTWEYSTDGSSWLPVATGTPVGATYTVTTTGNTTGVNAQSSTSTLSVLTNGTINPVGTYYYHAVVSSPSNCTNPVSATRQLFINNPIITVTPPSALYCNPSTPVSLTASGAGTGATYSWSPATGLSTTSGATVAASPSTTTTYTVTAIDALGCSKTATVTVTVGATVTPNVTASVNTACAGAPVVLSVVASGPANLPGIYCAAVNSGGALLNTVSFNTLSNTVTQVSPFVNTYPATGSTTTTVTAGQTYAFSAVSTTDITYPSSIASVWIDFNRDGVYSNSEWTQLWTSASSGSVNITIPSDAVGGATGMRVRTRGSGYVNGATDACITMGSGSTQDYTITVLGAIDTNTNTISWSSNPSGFSSNQANPTVNPTVNTTYTAVVTSSIGCSGSASTTVIINSNATITTQPVASTVCQGVTATFTVAASGPGLTYQWFKNSLASPVTGNASATTATLSLTGVLPSESGNYFVVVTPSCGATATSTPVALLVNPTPTVTVPAAQSYCAGTVTTPIVLVGTPSGVTFDISGGSAIGLVNQTAVTSIPSFTAITGVATITVTPKANGCVGIPVTYTITVNALPSVVVVSPAMLTICANDTPVLLTATGGSIAQTYCIPVMTNASASDDYINNFTFADLSNLNSGDTPTDYTYYSGLTANVVAGGTYNLSLAGSTSWTNQFRIWIDFNQDGIFQTTESVFATVTGSSSTIFGTATIPSTALNGVTRMRVAERFSSVISNTASCLGESTYGEFEDYNISITGGVNPVTAAVWTSTNGGLFTDTAGTAYNGITPRGTIYVRPSVTATITATVTNTAGCKSSSTSVVTVNPTPVANAPANQILCNAVATSAFTLVGTPSGVTFNVSGGASIGLANQTAVTAIPSFTPITGSATITVTPKANGCTGTAVTFTITVNPTSVAGTSSGATTLCSGTTSAITLTGSVGAIQWQQASNASGPWTNISGATAATLNFGSVTTTTYYQAVVTSGVCSLATSAVFTVNPNATPVITNSGNATTVCPGEIKTLTATATGSVGMVWSPTTGLFTDALATVPYTGTSATTVYAYVTGAMSYTATSTTAEGCSNSVTKSFTLATSGCPITPTVLAGQCGTTVSTLTTSVYATNYYGAQGFSFRVTNMTTGTVQVFQRPVNNLAFSSIPGVAYNTQYKIEIAVKTGGVWQPYFGAACYINTPNPVSTIGAQCGKTLTAINQWVNADYVPNVTAYRFKVVHSVTLDEQIITTSANKFNMTQLANWAYGTTYSVSVSLRNTDGTFLAYGTPCNIITPDFPESYIRDLQCGATIANNNEMIGAEYISGATIYRFKISNSSGYFAQIDRSLNSFNLSMLAGTGLIPGTAYSVQVSVKIGTVFGPFGKTCDITTPGLTKSVVAVNKDVEIFKATAYPNPFAENFKLDLTTTSKESVSVKVYDMIGKLVQDRQLNVSEIESFEVGNNYPSGVYNVILTQGDKIQTLRVIKR